MKLEKKVRWVSQMIEKVRMIKARKGGVVKGPHHKAHACDVGGS